jgi:hypothetical protein
MATEPRKLVSDEPLRGAIPTPGGLETSAAPDEGNCEHPEEERIPLTNGKGFHCSLCGANIHTAEFEGGKIAALEPGLIQAEDEEPPAYRPPYRPTPSEQATLDAWEAAAGVWDGKLRDAAEALLPRAIEVARIFKNKPRGAAYKGCTTRDAYFEMTLPHSARTVRHWLAQAGETDKRFANRPKSAMPATAAPKQAAAQTETTSTGLRLAGWLTPTARDAEALRDDTGAGNFFNLKEQAQLVILPPVEVHERYGILINGDITLEFAEIEAAAATFFTVDTVSGADFEMRLGRVYAAARKFQPVAAGGRSEGAGLWWETLACATEAERRAVWAASGEKEGQWRIARSRKPAGQSEIGGGSRSRRRGKSSRGRGAKAGGDLLQRERRLLRAMAAQPDRSRAAARGGRG